MKLLCKVNFDRFIRNTYYNADFNQNEIDVYVEDELDSINCYYFSKYKGEYYIYNYFYTEKEVRLLKLKKIEGVYENR